MYSRGISNLKVFARTNLQLWGCPELLSNLVLGIPCFAGNVMKWWSCLVRLGFDSGSQRKLGPWWIPWMAATMTWAKSKLSIYPWRLLMKSAGPNLQNTNAICLHSPYSTRISLRCARSLDQKKKDVMTLFARCNRGAVTMNNYLTRSKNLDYAWLAKPPHRFQSVFLGIRKNSWRF